MPKDFSQYDSKWGSKKYAGGTMAGCGCGPTSVADLVYDNDPTITPAKVADWLTANGFAGKAGNGTIRWGITHALEHYGFTDVRGIRNSSDDKSGKNDPTMQEFCKLISTGEYVGIILFTKGSRGGITWTSSGHFVTVYGAKKSGSDWILSVYDGGQREHDGNYSYNKTMKGLCYRAFVGKKPVNKGHKIDYIPSEEYKGTVPTQKVQRGDKGNGVLAMQQFLNWIIDAKLVEDDDFGPASFQAVLDFEETYGIPNYTGTFGPKCIAKAKELIEKYKPVVKKSYPGPFPNTNVVTKNNDECINKILAFAKKYADDNSYKYRKWSESNKYTHMCPIHHPESNEHATKGWNCRGFVAACLWHGGGIKDVKCSCSGLGLLGKKLSSYTLANWKKENGNDWTRVYNGGNNLKASQLKNGDVIFYFNSDKTMKHVALVYDIKNGKIADATSSKGITIRKPSTYGLVAFRYTGQQKTQTRSYIKKGDSGSNVGEWQDFLNWWSDGKFYEECGGRDDTFGTNTHNWSCKFQDEVMGKGEGTGEVGPKTINAAKAVLK